MNILFIFNCIVYSFLGFLLYKICFSSYEAYTNDPILKELQRQLAILDPEFKSIDINEGNKSYTINKKKVYICLKDEEGRYYDRNMLVYVILHELAHVKNKNDIGHTSKFYSIFNDLLIKAEKAGLYDPRIPPVKNYCGHD